MKQKIRNIAILAHVDAGKTTVSERILFTAREISSVGNVDEGLATMDYLPDEKEKGITIETGVNSFNWKEAKFNFLDTPGHVDFGAEVDQALNAADAGVLVISGSRGIETQTRAAWEKLREHQVPTMVFINKLDLGEQFLDTVLLDLEEEFERRVLLMNLPVHEDGKLLASGDVLMNIALCRDKAGRETKTCELGPEASKQRNRLWKELCEAASEVDDGILELLVTEHQPSVEQVTRALKTGFNKDLWLICYAGSALDSVGVRQLMTGLSLFSEVQPVEHVKNEIGKIIQYRYHRGAGGMYMFKSFVDLPAENWPEGWNFKEIHAEDLHPTEHLAENGIYALQEELSSLVPGDVINNSGNVSRNLWHGRYTSLMQTRLEASTEEDVDKIHQALALLDRSDPSLLVEYKAAEGCWIVSTVGEVQLDVLVSRLRREFRCAIQAGEPRVEYQERLEANPGRLKEAYQMPTGKVELELIPEVEEHGEYDLVWECSCPENVKAMIHSAVDEFRSLGIHGKGELTHLKMRVVRAESEGSPPPGAWRHVVQSIFQRQIPREIVGIWEPLMELEVSAPEEFCGKIIADMEKRGGKITLLDSDGKKNKIFCEIPLQEVFGYTKIVRSISKGTASNALRYKRHRRVP